MIKKLTRFFTSRLFVTSLFILLQIIVLFGTVYGLSQYFMWIQSFLVILSLILVVAVVSEDSNPTFKLAWVILMLTVPVIGWLLYFVFERRKVPKKTLRRYMSIAVASRKILKQDKDIEEKLKSESPSTSKICTYISNTAHTHVYEHTQTHFYPRGEDFFDDYIASLKSAKSFIFIEYFIIDQGKMWSRILEVLTEKAKQGVDVRVMYDDLGTINLLKKDYTKKLRKAGIKVAVFNPFRASVDTFMNYRDHRKITVIDGKTGFTGGLNIADEYINQRKRYGYWKDCALRLKGDAVSSLTLMFLQLWYFANNETKTKYEDYAKYTVKHYLDESVEQENDGYVQPFGDGPMTGHLTGEFAYMSIINSAKKYVYISTPYLILDNEMITCLKLAVLSGVDVRIITPNIPDKKYVHAVTRSNYQTLIKNGVRIFEYMPGFIHSKTIVSDDTRAIVGTTNFDFRSFYLHFENGVFMHGSEAVREVKQDYEDMLNDCVEITADWCESVSVLSRFCCSFLKLFSPLM